MANSSQYYTLLIGLILCSSITGGQAQGLTVSIVTKPASGPFIAADWIQISCHVTGNTSAVTYNWTLLCSSQDPPLVVNSRLNKTDVGEFSLSIRSTPNICQDTAKCTAADLSGNTGEATWKMGRVTGAGFWGSSNFIFNTSAFLASETGDIGTIYCHSTSNSSNVGQWISPEGQDITSNYTDPFSIRFNNGPGYPSYNIFELQSPTLQPFTSTYEGVYSCIVPDDEGVMRTLHLGIYTRQYSKPFQFLLSQLGRYSESPLILNCPTTGLPPTYVFWGKGALLSNGETYGITTHLRDRKNSTFDNFLHIRQTPQQAEGLYYFFVANALEGTVQNQTAGANVTSTDIFIAMYSIGTSNSITCTLDGAILYTWSDALGNTIVNGRQIVFSANDSIHNQFFACIGITQTLEVKYYYIKYITIVPNDVLQVAASSDDSSPVLGQSYSINCVGHKSRSGLINVPSPQWFTPAGSLLSTGADVQLQGPKTVGLSSSELVAQFTTLHTSHAGNYTCQVSLASPALTAPIVRSQSFGITVQIPPPTVTLTVLSSAPHAVGGTFTVQCQAVVSHHVNTPVTIKFTWRKTRGQLTTDSDTRVTISTVALVSSHTYRSNLTLTDLSIATDSNQNYSCQASVMSTLASAYILNSSIVTSNAYLLKVHAIGVTVTVSPAQTVVIDVPPSNSFTLTCTAVSVSNTSAETLFSWSKRALGSTSYTPLVHNGGSVNIVSSDDSSVLTASETQSGGYEYNCSARIGDAESSSDTAIVSVQGPRVPVPATDVESTMTSFSTVTISWSISGVAYTPETYAVKYGTNELHLTQRSAIISSSEGTTRYSLELTQLQDSTQYYFQVESNNTVGSISSEIQTFEVQNASVIISITSSDSSPSTGEMLTLTCSVVELVDHTGDTVVRWRGPEGQNISSGDDFLLTRQDTSQRVDYSLRFNPLRASHSGQYTCEVSIGSVGYFDSRTFTVSVTTATLGVNIQSTGSGKVGTSHELACEIDNSQTAPVGALTYKWTSTCSGECFVLRQSGLGTVSTQYLKAADSGTHTCTVTDSVGNQGNASVNTSATGVGLYHSTYGLLANNSVVLARNGLLEGSFFCLSGRLQPGIGQWISPSGNDYTLPGTHAFNVTVGGERNPGVVEISVSGSDHRFPAGLWDGVYSCLIPNEAGVEQIIYVGIYIVVFGSPPLPAVQLSVASSLGHYPHFTLNCSSSASAATEVSWTKDSEPINVDGLQYGTFQILREGTTSTYDNLLVMYTSDVNEHSGQYGCRVGNSFGNGTQEARFNGIGVSEHGIFGLGSTVTITCTSDFGVNSIEWLRNNQVISTSEGSQGNLSIASVQEIHHGRQYTCRAIASFGVQQRNITVQVEVDPESALTVNITSSSTLPQEGSAFSLTCVAIKSSLLQNTPTIDWYNAAGNRIVTDAGIRVGLLVESGDGTVIRSLTFLNLDTTHSMEYKCNTTIRFSPPPYVISKQAVWALTVDTNPNGEQVTDTTNESNSGGSQSSNSEALYLGAGIGGGLIFVVLVVLIILVILWWSRSRKLELRHREGNGVMFNNNYPIPVGMSQAYRMSGDHGMNTMMLPLAKHNDGPNLPPRNELYMTPPNAYERSADLYYYTSMASAPAFVNRKPPPPQYEPSKSNDSDQFYAEIPGESTTDEEEQTQDDGEYVSATETKFQLPPSEENKIDNDNSEKADTTVQELYGNL